MKSLKSASYFFIFIFFFQGIGHGQNSSFKIFDAINYLGKPNLYNEGFSKINLIYEVELLDYAPTSKKRNDRIVNRAKVQNVKRRLAKEPNIPVCLDVESWQTNKAMTKISTPKYEALMKEFLRNNQGIKQVAFFAKSISPKGVVFPSFYTVNDDWKAWEADVIKRTRLLRRFKDAKIYAFIWPQFNPDKNSPFAYKFIDDKFWRFQLETLYKYADGVVIWTPKKVYNKMIFFSVNMPWFKQTMEFIKAHNIN